MDSIVTTEDTIAAIASAISIGKGGVAIIRVSGKDAINSCKKIVQTKSKYAWDSHRVFHGFIQESKQNKFFQTKYLQDQQQLSKFRLEFFYYPSILYQNRCYTYFYQ